jgi:major membrane immunogen (membrane-anchored lipoprotein)
MIESLNGAYDADGKLQGYVVNSKCVPKKGITYANELFGGRDNASCPKFLRTALQSESGIYSRDFGALFSGIRPDRTSSDLPVENSPKRNTLHFGASGRNYRAELRSGRARYRDFVFIVVQGGRITEVTWDAVQSDGGSNRAKASVDGEYVLQDNTYIWAEQAYAMQNKLVQVQDPAKIAIKSDGTTEVVPNVSVTVNAFIKLANQCVEESKAGLYATLRQGYGRFFICRSIRYTGSRVRLPEPRNNLSGDSRNGGRDGNNDCIRRRNNGIVRSARRK